jgi:hypothetical protein
MLNKALDIAEKLGLQEGIAIQYSNLGVIYEMRGDAIKARQFVEKARDLFKKIGMPHMVKKTDESLKGLDKTEDRGQRTEDEG